MLASQNFLIQREPSGHTDLHLIRAISSLLEIRGRKLLGNARCISSGRSTDFVTGSRAASVPKVLFARSQNLLVLSTLGDVDHDLSS
jgi:hypothetical protein